MTDNKSSPGDVLAARSEILGSARRNNGVASELAPDRRPENPTDVNPPKPFKPKCTDLTAEYEGLNLGYVGGVRAPKKGT